MKYTIPALSIILFACSSANIQESKSDEVIDSEEKDIVEEDTQDELPNEDIEEPQEEEGGCSPDARVQSDYSHFYDLVLVRLQRAMQKIMKTLESDDSVATTTAAHYQHLVRYVFWNSQVSKRFLYIAICWALSK